MSADHRCGDPGRQHLERERPDGRRRNWSLLKPLRVLREVAPALTWTGPAWLLAAVAGVRDSGNGMRSARQMNLPTSQPPRVSM